MSVAEFAAGCGVEEVKHGRLAYVADRGLRQVESAEAAAVVCLALVEAGPTVPAVVDLHFLHLLS